MKSTYIALASVAALALSHSAFAQAAPAVAPTAAPAAKAAVGKLGGMFKPKPKAAVVAPAAAAPKTAANANNKPRTAASLECSKQADAKNLHGKAREAFRNACKKAAK
jgi:hypothetical protein